MYTHKHFLGLTRTRATGTQRRERCTREPIKNDKNLVNETIVDLVIERLPGSVAR